LTALVPVLFLALLGASVGTRLWLSRRQSAHLATRRTEVPEFFRDAITPEEQGKACAYARARLALGRLGTVAAALLLVGWTLGGGVEALQRLCGAGAAGDGGIVAGTALLLGAFAIQGLLLLPLAIARVFGIEQRFGFNRTTPRLFVVDLVKSAIVALVIGAPLAAGALWLMREAGRAWWLAAWAGWLAVSLLLMWIWPTWIAPLFNRFEPLPDGELARRLEALARRAGFEVDGIRVMDGSRRSAHGNAYFTGFGRRKRIALFDTLIGQLGEDQLEAVLGHELGHSARRHVVRLWALGAVSSLAGLAVLGWLAGRGWFYAGLGVDTPTPQAALLLFLWVAPHATFFAQPLAGMVSRRFEFEADAYAARLTSADAMAGALVRISKANAASLTADPAWSAFFDSHPPPLQRLARLRDVG